MSEGMLHRPSAPGKPCAGPVEPSGMLLPQARAIAPGAGGVVVMAVSAPSWRGREPAAGPLARSCGALTSEAVR